MIDWNDHINPWAIKLEEITLPDPAESWLKMQGLLNREMPASTRLHARRWILLVLLLLLIVGVCNCPGVLRLKKSAEINALTAPENKKANKPAGEKTGVKEDVSTNRPVAGRDQQKSTGLAIAPADKPNIPAGLKPGIGEKEKKENTVSIHAPEVKYKKQKQEKYYSPHHGKRQTSKRNKTADKNLSEDEIAGSPTNQSEEVRVNRDTLEKSLQDTLAKEPVPDSSYRKKNSTVKAPAPEKKKTDYEEYGKGWELGIGLNQFFPVGGQEKSNFNSSGTVGAWRDYIPVPMVRYYFSKSWYVQAEAQFNAPQYTKQLLASQVIGNTSTGSQDQNNLYIKKLFYFNLPVSIHYRLFRNFYLGTGIQFSSLRNGVGLFEDKVVNTGGGSDTVKSAKVENFKNTPVYKQLTTTEWRFLFDASYHWKPLTLGLRYNQAFTDFIHLQVSSTQFTQARNSSLQLYLRYVLWKNRKKIIVSK